MTDIKRLLNKKGWTGQELGMLELYNMAELFRQSLDGEEPKPVIDGAEFQKLINNIKDPIQGREYNGYISIHEWIVVAYNIAQTQFQQTQLQFRTLEGYVSKAIIAEDVFRYAEQLPYIITQKQYEKLKAERIEAYFKTEDGEELESNIFNLVERGIEYYYTQLRDNPKKANPLKAIRKKYINEPVKSKIILRDYNEVTGRGYYTLPDGRRSDQMSSEEWQEAITTKKAKEALTEMKKDLGGYEYTETLAMRRLTEKAKALFNGKTEEEADKEQKRREYEEGLATPVKWTQYTEPPTDLTKWDIIEDELLLNFYPAGLLNEEEDPYSEYNFNTSMQDFYSEFRELVDFILKDMDRRYFKGDEVQASKLELTEWGTTTISWRRLYELDFYGERAKAEGDINVFNGNKRALFNGIAIVRPSDILKKSRFIDEESGDYIPPKLNCKLESSSLEAFFTDSEEYADNVEVITDTRQTLIESYYFVKCFNHIMSRIAVLYKVPQLDVFLLPIKVLDKRIAALNELVPVLYKQIMDTDYSDKELQAKKLKVLQDYFQPIEYERLTIPEKTKEELEGYLKDFQTFKANSNILIKIMHKLPDGEGA